MCACGLVSAGGMEGGGAAQAQELLQIIHIIQIIHTIQISRGQSLEPPQRGGSKEGPQDTQLKDMSNQAQPHL